MTGSINRLLIVDPEPAIAEVIAFEGDKLGFATATAGNATEALGLVDSFHPTLILMELHLPDVDGVELLRMLGPRDCGADIILMSDVDERVLSTASELGATRGLSMLGTIGKPIVVGDLRNKLSAAVKQDRELNLTDLRRALAAAELVPYFQPKASLLPNRGWVIDGVEALVRWQHPRLGVVMPDEFIPLAERSGLISDLTEHVLRGALGYLKQWNDRGLKLKCAVNLSPSLVTDLSFPDRLAVLLAEQGLDPSQLSLEITETATMQEPTVTMDILTRLRVKRIGLSLDDFGTGFSSLTRLYQMPFDEMKIDKSLVINVPHSREANTMVGSLIELGHNLGLKICAEGVENRAALDLLEALGCDRCQGFFISRALPGDDIPSFVDHWNRHSAVSTWSQPAAGAVV